MKKGQVVDVDGTKISPITSAETVYRADGNTTIEDEISKYIPSEYITTMPTPNGEHTYFVAGADNTFPYPWGLLEIRYGVGTSEYTATLKTTGDDKNFYYCIYRNGVWSAWERLVKESELTNLFVRVDETITTDASGVQWIVFFNGSYVPIQAYCTSRNNTLIDIGVNEVGTDRYAVRAYSPNGTIIANTSLNVSFYCIRKSMITA